MFIFTWWNASGKRLPWLIALVLALAASFYVVREATAVAKPPQAQVSAVPKMKAWYREARREARRECLKREKLIEFGIKIHECVNGSQESGPCFRSLQGDTAWCEASFGVEWKEKFQVKVYFGTVHMHLARNGKIAVERPIYWVRYIKGGGIARASHRPITGDQAQRIATRYVRRHFCGHRLNFRCLDGTTVPLQVGFHSYWWRSSFQEARCQVWINAKRFCWDYQTHWSEGYVNGHTGRVTKAREW